MYRQREYVSNLRGRSHQESTACVNLILNELRSSTHPPLPFPLFLLSVGNWNQVCSSFHFLVQRPQLSLGVRFTSAGRAQRKASTVRETYHLGVTGSNPAAGKNASSLGT